MKHQHHLLFEAAILGEADQFEVHHMNWTDPNLWDLADERLTNIYLYPDLWTVRRKEKTHTVNGWEVPAPMTEVPKTGSEFWYEVAWDSDWTWNKNWYNDDHDQRAISRGMAHATKRGAVMNCKARHGVNPFDGEKS